MLSWKVCRKQCKNIALHIHQLELISNQTCTIRRHNRATAWRDHDQIKAKTRPVENEFPLNPSLLSSGFASSLDARE